MSKDQFLRQTLDRGEDLVDAGFAAAGRAMGRAIGFFRKLGPSKRKDGENNERVKVTRLPKRALPAPKHPTPSQVTPETDSGGQSLEQQIGELELELDHHYSTIIFGAQAGEAKRPAASASQLEEAVARARTLRGRIQELRQAHLRQQRELAREERLQQFGNAGPNERQAPQAGSKTRASEERSKRAGQRSPLAEIIKRAAPRDSAARLTFEKTAQGLLDPDPELRRLAASRLGELSLPATLPVLTAALEDSSDKVRLAALNALVQQSELPAAAVFKRFVESKNPHLRLAALRGLSKYDKEPGVNDRLIEALEDDQAMIRKAAAMTLGWRNAKEGVSALTLALHDEEAAVRRAAATSLGTLRDDQAVFSLINTIKDPDLTVREAAALALQTITGEPLPCKHDLADEALAQQVRALREWWQQSRIAIRLRQLGAEVDAAAALPPPVPAPEPEAERSAAGVAASTPGPAAATAVSEATPAAPASAPKKPVAPSRTPKAPVAPAHTPKEPAAPTASAPDAMSAPMSVAGALAAVSPAIEPASEEAGGGLLDDVAPELDGMMASGEEDGEGTGEEESSLLDSASLLDAPGLLLEGELSAETGDLAGFAAVLSPADEGAGELTGDFESMLGSEQQGEAEEVGEGQQEQEQEEEEEFESVL